MPWSAATLSGRRSPSTEPFLELRFADGHVERWLSTGTTEVVADTAQASRQRQRSATAAITVFPLDIALEVQRALDLAEPLLHRTEAVA